MSEDKIPQRAEVEKILRRFFINGTQTEFFELVFTSTRLIIAKLGGQPYLGVGQMMAAFSKSEKKMAELQTLSPDEILADNPENISIPYTNITYITMRRPGFLGTGGLVVQLGDNKAYTFRHSMKKQEFQGHIDSLQSILKEKIVVK